MSGLLVARFERGGSARRVFVVAARAPQIVRGPSRDHPVAARIHSSKDSSFRLQPARPGTHHQLKASIHPFLRGACGIAQPLLAQHVS